MITFKSPELAQLQRFDLSDKVIGDMAVALGDGLTEFKDRLRGDGVAPGTVWPIGTVKESKDGNLYYVAPGKGRRSGRSLRGWRLRQRGLNAVAENVAKDPKTRELYAGLIFLRGSGGGEGDAKREAGKIFAEETTKAGEKMAQIAAEALRG